MDADGWVRIADSIGNTVFWTAVVLIIPSVLYGTRSMWSAENRRRELLADVLKSENEKGK